MKYCMKVNLVVKQIRVSVLTTLWDAYTPPVTLLNKNKTTFINKDYFN